MSSKYWQNGFWLYKKLEKIELIIQAFFSVVDMGVLFLSGLGQYFKFSFTCKIGKIAFAAKVMHYLT